jgi:hypothetical protein
LQKFNKGQYLQNELLMSTVMKNDKSGIGYMSLVQKRAMNQNKPKQAPNKCFECGKEGHFAHNCKATINSFAQALKTFRFQCSLLA